MDIVLLLLGSLPGACPRDGAAVKVCLIGPQITITTSLAAR
jgi:hypothetical protein